MTIRLRLHTPKWFSSGMVFAGISCFSFGVFTLFRMDPVFRQFAIRSEMKTLRNDSGMCKRSLIVVWINMCSKFKGCRNITMENTVSLNI